jgi:tRNA (guanine37-N1)-methyltransferase
LNVWRNCSPNACYDEIIYVSADGEKFDQKMANDLSLKKNMIILCGHYKGIDQRVRDILITKEISIGDYVLTGGELAAMVISDAVIRLIPGAIGDGESALTDSFQDGLLDAPSYTRPPEFRGMKVPDVLLGGNHKEVAKWREKQRKLKTAQRRKDLL